MIIRTLVEETYFDLNQEKPPVKKSGNFSDALTFRDMYGNNKFGIGESYFYLNQG